MVLVEFILFILLVFITFAIHLIYFVVYFCRWKLIVLIGDKYKGTISFVEMAWYYKIAKFLSICIDVWNLIFTPIVYVMIITIYRIRFKYNLQKI